LLRQVKSTEIRLGQVTSGYFILLHVRSGCFVMTGYVRIFKVYSVFVSLIHFTSC